MLKELIKIRDRAADLLFPAYCVGCGKEGKHICENCRLFVSEASLICPVCQKTSNEGQRHPDCYKKGKLDGLISVWDYEGIIQELLLKVKYAGIFHATEELVEKAFEIREPHIPQGMKIAFVPMFKKKEKQRGFNQAEVISKKVAKITGKEVLCLLEKIKYTPPQTKLDKKERLENVKGSFALKKSACLKQIPEQVLLIDDVWTTGATMKECCKVLKTAGAKKVWGFTLAKTP